MAQVSGLYLVQVTMGTEIRRHKSLVFTPVPFPCQLALEWKGRNTTGGARSWQRRSGATLSWSKALIISLDKRFLNQRSRGS